MELYQDFVRFMETLGVSHVEAYLTAGEVIYPAHKPDKD